MFQLPMTDPFFDKLDPKDFSKCFYSCNPNSQWKMLLLT